MEELYLHCSMSVQYIKGVHTGVKFKQSSQVTVSLIFHLSNDFLEQINIQGPV